MAAKFDASLCGEPTTLFPIGLRSGQMKFVTVESFGDQLNANGVTLKTKQIFQLESDGQGRYAFKSHKGKYLTADNKTVTCNAATKGPKEWYTIQYQGGVVYIRNHENKNLSVDANGNLTLALTATANEEWEIVINFHPQVCWQTGKRYLAVEKDQVTSTRPTQFGRETTITIVPVEGVRGVHSFMGNNAKFFTCDATGNITCNAPNQQSPSTHFVIEFHANALAIRSVSANKYLSAQGTGVKASRAQVAAKEIFVLQDSDAQITLKANNGKFVAYQGPNVISVPKMGDKGEEIFILEFADGKWAFRTVTELYLSCKDSVLAVSSKTRGPDELFEFSFHNGKVAMKASNGKYLTAKPLGGIDAKAGDVNDTALFELYFFNRRELVFQTHMASFVGITNDKVLCNKANPEFFELVFENATYAVKHPGTGKYWNVGDSQRIVLGDKVERYFLEFHNNKAALKTAAGKYLKADNQGFVTASSDKPGEAELFEF